MSSSGDFPDRDSMLLNGTRLPSRFNLVARIDEEP
jgi:hypothetical protein